MHSMLCSMACRRTAAIGMRQAAELVRHASGRPGPGTCSSSSRRSAARAPARTRASSAGSSGLVPGDVQRHRRRRAHELEDRRAVVELLEDVARLARTGKPREPRAARADAPRRHGDAKRRRSRRQRLDVEAPAPQHLRRGARSPRPAPLVPAVVGRNQVVADLERAAISSILVGEFSSVNRRGATKSTPYEPGHGPTSRTRPAARRRPG